MGIMAWIVIILVVVAGAASGIAVLGWKRSKKQRVRADRIELTLNAITADVGRKNAALITIADNMEKLKDENESLDKSSLDGLIAHARELSDMVPKKYAGTGSDNKGGNTDTGSDTIPGRLI